jgi:hypothetical protein
MTLYVFYISARANAGDSASAHVSASAISSASASTGADASAKGCHVEQIRFLLVIGETSSGRNVGAPSLNIKSRKK